MKENRFYIAFDIDGTIYSTENILVEAYIEGIKEFNKKYDKNFIPPSYEQLFSLVGYPYREIFKNLYPELEDNLLEEFGNLIRKNLNNLVREGKGYYYPNIEYVIKKLKERGHFLLVASNGNISYIKAVLETLKVLDYFEDIIALDFKKIKNKGDILKVYVKKYNISPKRLIMIGDRKSDIDAAKEIGAYFIGTLYGHGNKEEIENSDYFIEKPMEILEKVEHIQKLLKYEWQVT